MVEAALSLLRVLHLEDDLDYCSLVKSVLEKEGWQVETAMVADISDFISALTRSAFDVILADYSLPKCTGIDALRAARQYSPNTPFLVVSGTIGEQAAIESLRSGATDYVLKHWPERLEPAVRRAVQEAREHAQRKRAEEVLRQNEEEFRAMFELASIGMAQADVHTGRWLRVNQKMCTITGYSTQEMLRMRIADITHPEDLQRDVEVLQKMTRGESPDGRMEKRYIRKDGLAVWVNVNLTVIRNADGRPARTMAAIEDISERKEAERRLRQLSQAVEQSASTVIITDTNGSIMYANPRCVETTGYSLEQLVGKNTRILKSGLTPSGVYAELWQTVTSGHTWRGQLHNKRKTGEFYWEQASISPVIDERGIITHFVAVKEDVTKHRAVQDALYESEERFRTLFELAPDGIYLCDLQGRFLDGNLAAEDLVGYPKVELIGKSFLALRLLSESDLLRAAEALARNVKGQPTGPDEYILIRKDGKQVPVEIRTFPIKLRDKPLVLGVARNMIERKQLEAQLRHAQKMEGIGQLAGGVAHDFNNLLAVMRGNAELPLMDADQNSPQTNECLGQIVAAAERAGALTRQLLIFSRKEAMKPEPLALNDVVKQLTKMLKRLIREDIHLQCRYAAQLPLIQADPSMLEQVLLNLLLNARDAMPGGGQLVISTDLVSIGPPYTQTNPEARVGSFVTLRVSDTGTGIATEHLERIFEPFFTTKESGKGTGLGLAIVYGIVKQHQGWVEVVSQVRHGTTFKVFLPTTPVSVSTVAAPVAAELHGGTETILLVEDDNAVRLIMRHVLETFNYTVYEATCAREAMDIWNQHAEAIALLLTDMVMPGGVSGRALAEQLHARRPSLKVIFMSGYSEEVAGNDTEFFHRTRAYFLRKPSATAKLIQTVRQCLDANEAEDLKSPERER